MRKTHQRDLKICSIRQQPLPEVIAGKRLSCNIHIPLDLTVEILKKLLGKSLARFRCVSKQWKRIINDFVLIDSIVPRSMTQSPRDPHFIFLRRSSSKTLLCPMLSESSSVFSYSYPHQITNDEPLYHEEIFGKNEDSNETRFQYLRGLIGFWVSDYDQFTIHNPTTRQSVSLPKPLSYESMIYLFGYDPFKNQYKVLCLTLYQEEQSCKVFILGDPTEQWRDIHCNIGRHFPFQQAVCLNGAIYYKAMNVNGSTVLVSFDTRSEIFNHVQTPENLLSGKGGDITLVSYQGNLGCIHCNDLNKEDMDMWVMENGAKQDWSKITFSDILQDLPISIRLAGVTYPGGEIVIVHINYRGNEFAPDVYYYNPKLNSRRRVQIQTTMSSDRLRSSGYLVRMLAITDPVENIIRL